MRTVKKLFIPIILFCFILGNIYSSRSEQQAVTSAEKLYYAIEIGGVICGYTEVSVSPFRKDGKNLLSLEWKTYALISVLGSTLETEILLRYHIDPATGDFTYHTSDIKQGSTQLSSLVEIKGDTAWMTTSLSDKPKPIALPKGVILENSLLFPFLIKDFIAGKAEKKTYDIFEVRDGEVQQTTYTRIGIETLELCGKRYNALVVDEINHKTGLKIKWWLDSTNGYFLKSSFLDRNVFLTDASVVKKVQMATLDENYYVKTNVSIADFQAITNMKVQVSAEPIGVSLTPALLNVPGQRFTGTVKNNLIEGIFEIEHKRYDGKNAPPFPPQFGGNAVVKKFLEPEEMIESADSVMVKQAKEITKGSKDSWEAACRLSKWVYENITYAIPGGGSARKTYDSRKGECGAHSLLLAAFCRAVGIPARVVWGCMYIPNYGGAFGQHAWNEIYLGDNGWITVDATANEINYVDSGHIRIGIFQSLTTTFNGKKMEILDYRAGTMQMGKVIEEIAPEMYAPYVGNYSTPNMTDPVKVFVQNNSLTMDIPGKIVLPFNSPDKNGLWFCKFSNKLFLTFTKSNTGTAQELKLHEIIYIPRKSTPDTISKDVPESFKRYVGTYLFEALRAEFTITVKDGSLAVYDPMAKQTIKLQSPDANGRWMDEFNKNVIFFDSSEDGTITAMNIESITTFRRK